MNRFLARLLLALSMTFAMVPFASAKEMLYGITISWTSGPLKGSQSVGYVSFDDSLARPDAEYSAPNLLSRFTFRVKQFRYSGPNVTSAFLSFDSKGALRQLIFGTSCAPGSCASQPGDPRSLYFVYDSQSNLDPFFAIQGPPEEGKQSYGVGTLRRIPFFRGFDPFALDD